MAENVAEGCNSWMLEDAKKIAIKQEEFVTVKARRRAHLIKELILALHGQ